MSEIKFLLEKAGFLVIMYDKLSFGRGLIVAEKQG